MRTRVWVAATGLLLLLQMARAEALEAEQREEGEGEGEVAGEGKCKAGEPGQQPHLSLTTRTQRAQVSDDSAWRCVAAPSSLPPTLLL